MGWISTAIDTRRAAKAHVATLPTVAKAPFATIYSRNTAAIQDKQEAKKMSGGVLNLICCACVPQSTAGVVERFGKFSRVISPGLNFLACCIGEFVAGSVSLRVRQLDVTIETKTKDNVFVVVVVSVQYEVENDQVYDAFYRLTNPLEQIRAYVFDVVRSTVPKINLDDVFDQKDEIAKAVKTDLAQTMPSYGYHILQTLVTDIEPDSRVKSSMNEINAAQRQRVAAADKAEAEKILVVKGAEADAESKYLAGVGISRQRQAIVNGLRDSVQAFTREITDVSPRDVLEIMMMTQYFDMMKDVGSNSRTSTIFVPNTPGAVSDVSSQIRNGFLQAAAGMPEQQNMRR